MRRLLFVILAACVSMAATGQTQTVEEPSTRAQLVEMNATLHEIARELRADLMMKRVTLATTQLAAAEEKLKRIDQETGTVREQLGEFEAAQKAIQAKEPASEEAANVRREQIAEINRRLTGFQDRLAVLARERIDSANEIEALRRDARDWQAQLDKALANRP